jgi:hypothetical protein
MNNRTISAKRALLQSLTFAAGASLLLLSVLRASASAEDANAEAQKGPSFPATHVLGLPNTHPNASGSLVMEGGSLRFESKQGVRLIPIVSLEGVLVSQAEKQIGGTPMTLGKAAAPFGGGRVVSLFAHKQYDEVSLVYRDDNGGIHGVISSCREGKA